MLYGLRFVRLYRLGNTYLASFTTFLPLAMVYPSSCSINCARSNDPLTSPSLFYLANSVLPPTLPKCLPASNVPCASFLPHRACPIHRGLIAYASPLQRPKTPTWGRRGTESSSKDPDGMSVLSRYALHPTLPLPPTQSPSPRPEAQVLWQPTELQ